MSLYEGVIQLVAVGRFNAADHCRKVQCNWSLYKGLIQLVAVGRFDAADHCRKV